MDHNIDVNDVYHSGPNIGIIRQITGAPNDGFLLNRLESFFRLSRVPLRSLEMHSKGGYKICTCSVILGELESLPKVICPKKLTLAHNVFEGTELVALELIF